VDERWHICVRTRIWPACTVDVSLAKLAQTINQTLTHLAGVHATKSFRAWPNPTICGVSGETFSPFPSALPFVFVSVCGFAVAQRGPDVSGPSRCDTATDQGLPVLQLTRHRVSQCSANGARILATCAFKPADCDQELHHFSLILTGQMQLTNGQHCKNGKI
jgi:hypothetical protein